jgi:hypothetical protein
VLATSIKISNSESVKSVWFDVYTADGFERLNSGNIMTNVEYGSTRTYSGSVNLSETLLSGKYEIVYFVEDNIRTKDENIRKVAAKIFRFESETENFPPVISNLIIPQEVSRGEEFIFSVNVLDPNGKNDVKEVYFTLLRPDSTIVYSNNSGDTKFPMFDNGDPNIGDQTAGDGVYSLKNSFGSTSQTGNWTFTFNAVDRSDSLSNTIIHILNVK